MATLTSARVRRRPQSRSQRGSGPPPRFDPATVTSAFVSLLEVFCRVALLSERRVEREDHFETTFEEAPFTALILANHVVCGPHHDMPGGGRLAGEPEERRLN